MGQRYYRSFRSGDLISFNIRCFESDLLIRARTDVRARALSVLRRAHEQVRLYGQRYPVFLSSREPLPLDTQAPPVVRAMMRAGLRARVGPMAAVAGAIADAVGRDLLRLSRDVIVENGGDVFLSVSRVCRVGVFAGPAQVFNRLAIRVAPGQTPCGVCASSATMGHSLSLGASSATIILARNAALADAFATAFGNMVQTADDLERVLAQARRLPSVRGIVIVTKDTIAGAGAIEWEILDK